MNFGSYQRLNDLIASKSTGPVCKLAKRLGVSPRTIKSMIKKMREECGAPIYFDKTRQSYIYRKDGVCDFKFHESKREYITEVVLEALRKCFSLLTYLFF